MRLIIAGSMLLALACPAWASGQTVITTQAQWQAATTVQAAGASAVRIEGTLINSGQPGWALI